MDFEERLKATGRNDRCPCGSGKKYKKCHLNEDEDKRTAALKAQEEQAIAKTAEEAEAAADGDAEGEGEADTKAAGKGKRAAKRGRGQSGSKAQVGDAKPRNIPRRGAV